MFSETIGKLIPGKDPFEKPVSPLFRDFLYARDLDDIYAYSIYHITVFYTAKQAACASNFDKIIYLG
jgi:hypothetical protein